MDNFEFRKKIYVYENSYRNHDIHEYFSLINQLLVCMKETNKKHKKENEFFVLEFRESMPQDDTSMPYVMEMKWGRKDGTD